MMNPRCRRLATSRAERGCPFGQINGRSIRCMEARGPSPTVERPFAWNAPAVHSTLDRQVGADVCAEICRERHRKPGALLPSGARTAAGARGTGRGWSAGDRAGLGRGGPGGWGAGAGRLERGGPGGWSAGTGRRGRTIRRIVAFFKPYKARVAIVLSAILLTSFIGLINPILLKLLIDVAIPQRDFGLLNLFVGLMIVLPIASGLIGVGQSYLNN